MVEEKQSTKNVSLLTLRAKRYANASSTYPLLSAAKIWPNCHLQLLYCYCLCSILRPCHAFSPSSNIRNERRIVECVQRCWRRLVVDQRRCAEILCFFYHFVEAKKICCSSSNWPSNFILAVRRASAFYCCAWISRILLAIDTRQNTGALQRISRHARWVRFINFSKYSICDCC